MLSGGRHLDLSHNNLESTIPSEIGNMKGLQYLLLNDNELSGPIPSDLGRLSELNVLDLSTNKLTSSVPEEFRSLTGLTFPALLGYNQLTGQLSKDLCALDVDWFVDCEKVTCPTTTDGGMYVPVLVRRNGGPIGRRRLAPHRLLLLVPEVLIKVVVV
jgi:Leucine Rich Repeat